MIEIKVLQNPIPKEIQLQISTTYAKAFTADPLFVYMQPDEKKRFNELIPFFQMMVKIGVKKGIYHVLVDCDDNQKTESIIASALWHPHNTAFHSVLDIIQAGFIKMLWKKSSWRMTHLIPLYEEVEELHKALVPNPHQYFDEILLEKITKTKGK